MGYSMKDLQSLLFIDLLPHDIFIKTETGYEIVIPKGTSVPSRRTVEFVLTEENQTSLSVEIFRNASTSDDYVVGHCFRFINNRRLVSLSLLSIRRSCRILPLASRLPLRRTGAFWQSAQERTNPRSTS